MTAGLSAVSGGPGSGDGPSGSPVSPDTAARAARTSSTAQPGSQDSARPVTELTWPSHAAKLTCHPELGIDGPVTAVTRVTAPMPTSTTPDAAVPSGISP